MIYVTTAVLLGLEIISWKRFHDLKSPGFLFGIFWIISLVNLRTMPLYSIVADSALIIIAIGAIVFQIGFEFGIHIKINRREYYLIPKNKTMKWLIIILVIIAVPVIIQYFNYIRSFNGSLYSAIRSAEMSFNLPVLFDYYRKITQFIFIAFATVYWREPINKRNEVKPYVLTLFIIALLATISVPTRNSILFFLLPLLMCWFFTHDTDNKKMILSLSFAVLGFLVIFYIISTGKYWYLYTGNGANRFEIIKNELQMYLSGSIAAFSNTWIDHSFTSDGGNTFRFFIAVLDVIFDHHNALPLVNDFITFPDGSRTNVYTFYDFYLRDYGIVYALIIQFFIAILHGVNYTKAKTGSLFGIFLFSMLSYPLIMQFFQDQYISLLSTWFQIIVVGIIVLKTNLFFRITYIAQESF